MQQETISVPSHATMTTTGHRKPAFSSIPSNEKRVTLAVFLVLTDCFNMFDLDGNGAISADELPDALLFAGIHATEQGIQDIITAFDKNGEWPNSETGKAEERNVILPKLQFNSLQVKYRST